MVFSRWAIVITVEFFSFSRTTLQITCSVSGSTCAVGSSKMITFFRCKRTRAKQINCRSPALKFAPCSNNSWCSCPSRFSTNPFSWTSSKAFHSSKSWNWSTRSRFLLSDPLKRTGLWPSTDIHRRVSWRLISFIGTPSIMTFPSASGMRRKAATRDDFPAPVLPATPNLDPPFNLRFMFLSTCGPPG